MSAVTNAYVRRTGKLVNETASELSEQIVKESNNEISKEEAMNLAYRCVARMDFNNKYQMHRSLNSYAQSIVYKWREKK